MTLSPDLLSLPLSLPTWLGALIESSIKGTVILAVAALISFSLRRGSAAARHFVWSTALGSLAVLPLLTVALPAWRVPLLPPAASQSPEQPAVPPRAAEGEMTASTRAVSAANGAVTARPAPPLPDQVEAPRHTSARPVETIFDAPATLSRVRETADRPGSMVSTTKADDAPISWSTTFIVVWVSGALLALLPVVVGLARVRWLVHRARPADGDAWGSLAREIAEGLGVRREVRVLESHANAMPMTFGTLRPVILVPSGSESWPMARRRDVLLHELAHVQRYDSLTQRIAQLACAIHWVNPLVWKAAARLHAERERACDDLVINAGARAPEYARHLLDVARTLRAARATGAAAMAMARPSQLEGRLLAVLDARVSRRAVPRRLAARGWLAAACLILPLAAFRPAPIDGAGESPARRGPFGGRRDAFAAARRLPPRASTPVASESVPTGRGSPAVVESPAQPSALTDAPPAVTPASPAMAAVASDTGRVDPCWRTDGKSGQYTNWTQDDGRNKRWTVRWGRGRCRVELEAEGTIEFTSDLTDIASISPRGSFDLREIDGDLERRVEILADGGGALARRYLVNGREQPFDAAGRAWLGTMLVELERTSAFAAETRVPRLLKDKGVSGVLDEIALLRGDYAKKVYFQALFKLSPPKGPDLERAVREAGRSVSSDYELAEILIGLGGEGLVDKSLQSAYVEAIGSISSDYERRRALTPLLKQSKLDPALAPALFKVATAIDSDYELAELLLDISSRFAVDEKTRPDFFVAVGSLESDYEHRRVLSALLKQKGLGKPFVSDVLASATKLESDYELAELLIELAKSQNLDGSLDDAFFRAVNTLGSDYEHARVLKTMLERERLSKSSVVALLRSSAAIDSDYEAAGVLTMVAEKYPLDDAMRQEFMKAADSVGSEHDYGRVMAALRRRTASQ